jgi:hypothetical protein
MFPKSVKHIFFVTALSSFADLIAQLQTAEDDFEQARIAYETEKAKEGMVNNATLVKKDVLKILNDKVVVYLRAMELVNPATYGVFASTVLPRLLPTTTNR